ncbi:putative RNA-directed DNA polymerase [Tanacetum coccineum]
MVILQKKGDSSSSDINLTFGNPLYLHPNDTGGSPIVTIKLTGPDNYKVWSIAMTFALRNHNKIGFIDGTCKKDDTDPALANQWDMCNSVVFTWILNSLSPDLYAGAIYAKNASELWTDLKDTYDKVDGSAVFNLHKSINSLSQSGASLADYYNNLNSLWKQFDAMISLPACSCDAAKHFEKHNQLIKLMQFLMGLDENYLAIRSNILTRETLPLVKVAFAIVSGEESHRNITSTSSTKPTATAFMFFKLFVILLVMLRGTLILIPRLVDPNFNNAGSNTTSNSPISLSNEQLTRLMNLLNDSGVSSANANILGWIVDSGTNQHMTVSAKFLVNVVDIFNLGLTVSHPNEYTVSFLSVYKLSRDNKMFVGIDESNCYIQDLKANKIIGIGRQFNGLYMFDVDKACKIVSNNCISSCFVSKYLWHQRLGHPSDQVLDVLKTSLNLDSQTASDHLCDTCNKAKQIRELFPLSDHKSSTIGRVSSNDDGTELSPDVNQGNDDSGATSMDETNNTHPEGTVPNETDFINEFYEHSELNSDVEELPANTVRRSSRQTKLPSSLNDFIIEGKVKYGVERVVNYANLNHAIYCFISALNKSIEPTCYEEVVLDRFANKDNKNKVCKLVKSLYGLKQAPRKWNEKLVTILKENDFVQSANDHSLFTKSKNNKFIALLVYVDDIVVTGNFVDEIDKFKIFLKSKFKIKDLGHLKYILGIEVIKSDNDLCLSQRKYCKPVSTPMVPNSVLPYEPTKDDPLLDNITGYQKLLGKLICLTHTRPDIAYYVHCLA